VRPVLLLEINEVPLRIWKKYGADSRYPSIARILKEGSITQTVLADEGELSPWCTWPTFHRGLLKKEHGIYNLGQDPSTFRGTPIWEEFRAKGLPVGIFGSLQSWPPKDSGEGGFHVPDTFATDARCFPAHIEPVQAFNLSQVRSNARVMSEKVVERPPAIGLLIAMLRSGVRFGTLCRIALQLVSEKFVPSLRERRVTFQALLFWDIFRAHFDPRQPPAFTTFFTNHIASVQHRFWNHIFPGDFPVSRRPKAGEHAATMDFAMSALEEIISEALSWRDQNPQLLLLVANSMGQAAVIRESHEGFELLLRSPLRLLGLFGIGENVRQNLAMMPQVALEFSDVETAQKVKLALGSVTTVGGKSLLSGDLRGATLSITATTPRANEISSGEILVGGKRTKLEEAGFFRAEVEAGTAYHVPEGLLLAHGLSSDTAVPESLPTHQVKALILSWAGL